jgi:DNA-binding PadR family transcriptional regulator
MRGFWFGHRHHCGDAYDGMMRAARRGHHGFGPFAAAFLGGAGLGGHGFRMGRKLASGELQLVLLALLDEQPSHGYELIKALEERSGGFYVPSPGMIYPALTWLEEVGYAIVAQDGTKKLYRITDTGREYLKENREAADAMLSQLQRIGSRMGRVREVFSGWDDHTSDVVHEARRELRRALREKVNASGREAARIAAILKRAAAEILGKE